MIPLKKWWISQICLDVADNEESVKLMKASGCKGVFVGLESVSAETLEDQRKEAVNIVEKYIRQSRTLLKQGLVIVGAIMFGFDTDTKKILFSDTLKMLEKMGLTMLNDLIATPYPHLDFFETLNKDGRIITKEAKYYNGYTVVHKPKHIHPAELQEGAINVRKRFYSWPSTIKRMVKHNFSKYPEFLIWNRLWGTTNYEVIPGVNVKEWLNYLKNVVARLWHNIFNLLFYLKQ